MAEPIFAFNAKDFIADYKNALDQFISDLNHIIVDIKLKPVIKDDDVCLKRLAEDIIRLEKKTEILLSAPLDEDLIYNIEIIKNILNQKVFVSEEQATLHSAAEEHEKKQQLSQLKFLIEKYLEFPAEANRLIEGLDLVSHDFYDFLRM